MRCAPGEGFPGQIWAEGRTRSVSDLPADASFRHHEEVAGLGLRGAVGFPVRVGDEILGVIEFLGRRMDEPEPALLETFEAIGRQIGLFVERRRGEARERRFVSGSPAVIYALRVEAEGQHLVWFSDNLEQMTGWRSVPEDDAAWWRENIHPDDLEKVLSSFGVPYEVEHQVLEFRFRRPDGRYLWVRDERRLLRDADGQPSEIVGSWTDVTERVELEDKLRVAQKLEAIGRLAGGVAHDFNNMLTVIAGNGEILDRVLPAEGSERALLAEIREAAARSAALTRQLLAFSRTQVLAPRVVRMEEVVEGVETMLRRLIGEDVSLVCDLDRAAGHVLVDRGQLEQVIINLAVNARDAMPRGGTLTVATSAIDLDEHACRSRAGLAPGTFARLEVRDTGNGMRPEVRERIFEPFFTTKPVGTGTGLGLSTAFGFVTQSGGHIEVESIEGVGTTFVIFLPRVAPPTALDGDEAGARISSSGGETVLVVEDEPGVRRVVRLALEKLGYKLLVAASGREAVMLGEQHHEAIDLLLTDLVMPEMSGTELAGILRARRPGLAVLLMSGYVEDDFVRHGVVTEEVAFLHKPFTIAELAAKVSETLAARS
jgi:PAS domain S-box-containing protein